MLADLDRPLPDLIKSRDMSVSTGPVHTRSTNPFTLPDAVDSFGFREQNKLELSLKRRSMRQMTLVQRAEAEKPKVPPCSTQKTRSNSVLSTHSFSNSQGSSVRYEKHPRVPEFIQQKREIYILQMLIDKKNKEIQKLSSLMKNEESDIVQKEQRIEKESQAVKFMTTKSEARLARARKKAENAARKRVELQKKHKQVATSCATIRSEIFKNEETLETYTTYRDFLAELVPKGKEMFEYFNSPKVLLDDIAFSENNNLFIIDRCEYIGDNVEAGCDKVKKSLNETEKDINAVDAQHEKFLKLHPPEPEVQDLSEENAKYTQGIDDELLRLTELVRKTYFKCLNKDSDVSALLMLEDIEKQLHILQTKILLVDPAFIEEKQTIKDRERRDQQRKEKQEKLEIEQANKMKHTLERANRPIKKRMGRPIYGRVKLMKHEKKDEEKSGRQKMEQQRIEELLYGPIQ